MPEIITIGETMAAFTPESTGFLRYVSNYRMRIAGAESNLAIGVCKLGHSAGWVSSLGKDEFGEFVRNSISTYAPIPIPHITARYTNPSPNIVEI